MSASLFVLSHLFRGEICVSTCGCDVLCSVSTCGCDVPCSVSTCGCDVLCSVGTCGCDVLCKYFSNFLCWMLLSICHLRSPSLKNALSTPTATDRLKLLSPAARKLAQKATPTRSVDTSLRSSYTPTHTPSASPLIRPQTGSTRKRSQNSSTPSITAQKESQGNRTPSTPLLSDNLLQLNK